MAPAARRSSRVQLTSARGRLRARAWPILQTAAAAVGAWYLALLLLPAQQPLFAPIAALIAIGAATGHRGRRAFELVGGVILGIAVADVIVHVIGTGPWQAGVMIVLAMGAAVAMGGGELLTSEAAVSAILIATLDPGGSGLSPDRFLEALIGGGVALLVSVFLFPPDPALQVARAINDVFAALGRALGDIGRALEAGDGRAASRALDDARAIDDQVDSVRRRLLEVSETARFAPLRRRSRSQVARFERSLPQVDFAVRDTRVLARSVVRFIRGGRPAPPVLADALHDLAEAVWDLAAAYDDGGRDAEVRRVALGAAARVTDLAEERRELGLTEIGVQVRSVAVDLVRAAEFAAGEQVEVPERPTEEMLSTA